MSGMTIGKGIALLPPIPLVGTASDRAVTYESTTDQAEGVFGGDAMVTQTATLDASV